MKMKKVTVKLNRIKLTNINKSKLKKPKKDKKDKTAKLSIPKISKSPKIPKVNTINHNWKKNEVVALIEAVKGRPQMWNKEHEEYCLKGTSRNKIWEDIALDLGNKEIDGTQAKLKWKYVRKQYASNGHKNWKFKEYMLFLVEPKAFPEVEKVHSYYQIEPEVVLSESNAEVSSPNKCHSIDVSTTKQIDDVSTPFVRRCIQSTELSSSSVPILEAGDTNSSFCEHLLAELYTLSDVDSRHLRRLLMQVVYDFADTPED